MTGRRGVHGGAGVAPADRRAQSCGVGASGPRMAFSLDIPSTTTRTASISPRLWRRPRRHRTAKGGTPATGLLLRPWWRRGRNDDAGRHGRWWAGRAGQRDRGLGFIAAYRSGVSSSSPVDVVVNQRALRPRQRGAGLRSSVVSSVGPPSADERGRTYPAGRSESRRSPRRTAMPFSTHRSEEWMT